MSMFHDLARNRARARQESMQYGIFRVKKDGCLSAKPSVQVMTREEADAKRIYLETVNPGSVYVVLSRGER